ncbi:MAG: hypothetical protein WA118_08890 [Carboxydocellales bacterium]
MAYAPTTWLTGDIITAAKLNNMEAGIAAAVLRAGDTMTAKLLISKNIGLVPNYASGQLELQSTNGDDVVLGFHRVGLTACALVHKDGIPGLYLVDNVDALTDLRAGVIYSGGNTVYHAGNLVLTSYGTYADTTTSIPASSTININIPVGSGKAKARLHFLGVSGGIVDCSTVGADTVGTFINGSVTATYLRSVSGYVFDSGIIGSEIRLLDAYISGTNLVLACQNTNAGAARTVNIRKLHWQAF